MKGKAKDDKIKYIKTRGRRAKEVLRGYKMDARKADVGKKAGCEKKAREFEARINGLLLDLEAEEKQADQIELLGDKQNESKERVDGDDSQSTKEILEEAIDIQQDDIKRLGGIRSNAAATANLGAEILIEMDDQRKQLEHVDEVMNSISADLKLAGKQLRILVRGVPKDKITMCFLLLVFLGVIAVIIYGAVSPSKDTNAHYILMPTETNSIGSTLNTK